MFISWHVWISDKLNTLFFLCFTSLSLLKKIHNDRYFLNDQNYWVQFYNLAKSISHPLAHDVNNARNSSYFATAAPTWYLLHAPNVSSFSRLLSNTRCQRPWAWQGDLPGSHQIRLDHCRVWWEFETRHSFLSKLLNKESSWLINNDAHLFFLCTPVGRLCAAVPQMVIYC